MAILNSEFTPSKEHDDGAPVFPEMRQIDRREDPTRPRVAPTSAARIDALIGAALGLFGAELQVGLSR